MASSQRGAFAIAAGTVALLVAQQVASKAARDALFLGQWSVEYLPWAMLGSAAGSLLAAFGLTRILRRFGPARVIPGVLLVSCLLYLLEWYLADRYRSAVAWSLYFHVATLGATTLSGFWSVYGELFDPNTAKRLMGRVGAGATLGGVLGAVAVERLSASVDVRINLLFLAALHALGAVGITRLMKFVVPQEQLVPAEAIDTGLFRDKYLVLIGLMVAATSASAALVDYAFKIEATEAIGSETGLVRFFAIFYAGVALAGFLVQWLLSGPALRHLGIGGTLALLPGVLTVCSAVALLWTKLPTLLALRGASSVLLVSTHRSAYELLYTPLRQDQRRSTKTLIDIALDRAGDAVGSGAILVILAVAPLAAERISILAGGVLAAFGLLLAWHLNRGYVSQLAESLTTGALDAKLISAADATTQRTIAETTLGWSRRDLLAEIAKLRVAEGTADPPSELTRLLETPRSIRPRKDWRRSGRALLFGQSSEIAALLQQDAVPARLAGLVMPLLEDSELEEPARAYLIGKASQVVGALHDALLDPELELSIRRKIPRVLRAYTHPRSFFALLDALESERFELRYRAGQALVALHDALPSFVFDEEKIFALVLVELGHQSQHPSPDEFNPAAEALNSIEGEASGWLTQALRRRLRHRLEHVFSLLSLVRERAPLHACLIALYGSDEHLKGTALEYLENILPTPLGDRLFPLLEVPIQRSSRLSRSTPEVLNELLRSSDLFNIDRSLLKP